MAKAEDRLNRVRGLKIRLLAPAKSWHQASLKMKKARLPTVHDVERDDDRLAGLFALPLPQAEK
jgi:hypothetical protein